MSKLFRFNEGVSEEDVLLNYIKDVFAYLSDDYNVIIEKKDKEIFVEIKTILASNVIWKLDEYIDKSIVWQEVILDIDVAVKRIQSRFKNISYSGVVNTVGNVKLSFLLLNEKLMTSNNLSITIGKQYLLKLLDDEKVKDIVMDDINYDRNKLRICFKEQIIPDYQEKFIDKITKIFKDNGIEASGKSYNHSVYNLTIAIYQPRDNNKNLYKRIKIQNVV